MALFYHPHCIKFPHKCQYLFLYNALRFFHKFKSSSRAYMLAYFTRTMLFFAKASIQCPFFHCLLRFTALLYHSNKKCLPSARSSIPPHTCRPLPYFPFSYCFTSTPRFRSRKAFFQFYPTHGRVYRSKQAVFFPAPLLKIIVFFYENYCI